MYKYINSWEIRKLEEILIDILNAKKNSFDDIYKRFFNSKLSVKEYVDMYYNMSLEEITKDHYYLNIDNKMFDFIKDNNIIDDIQIDIKNYDNHNYNMKPLCPRVHTYSLRKIIEVITEKYNYEIATTYYSELNPYMYYIDEEFDDFSNEVKDIIDDEYNDLKDFYISDEDYSEEEKKELIEKIKTDYFDNREEDAYIVLIKNFKFSKRAKEILNVIVNENEEEDFFLGRIEEKLKDGVINTYIIIPYSIYNFQNYYLKLINILILELYLYKTESEKLENFI